MSAAVVQFVDLGTMAFQAAWDLQLAQVAKRQADLVADTIYMVEHPHVITLGRAQKAAGNVVAAGDVDVVAIERGGDVTYHGPGQLVCYPIIKLAPGEQDLHGYLRNLEQAVIDTCVELGVPAGRELGKTGVWTGQAVAAGAALAEADTLAAGPRKLCSIGIACRKWVTFHGLALNVTTDLSYFYRINPCGFESRVMTSLGQEFGDRGGHVTMASVKAALAMHLAAALRRASV